VSTPPDAADPAAPTPPAPVRPGDRGEPVGAQTPPAPAERSRAAQARGIGKRIAQAVAAVGALVGVLAGVTSLVDWVGEQLSDPLSVTIAPDIVSIERHDPQLLGDWLADTGRSARGYTRDELARSGLVFGVKIRIQGERGKTFALRYFVVDKDRGARLRGPGFNQEPAIFRVRNDDQTATELVWVPYAAQPGRYRVTFLLDNAKRQPVAQKAEAFEIPERR
jgi:hypothetical protein